ncbi:MAG TPA: exodeoxyribonuclease VII large subunit [Burkholderiales bacterium]|nr:exodeoxyribonuclease VII large subunit [Burkholderiales bacterium]
MATDFDRGVDSLHLASLPGGVPLTVSQLNASARRLIERNMPVLWVAGELSNFTRAPSGHWYFSLKDARAQLRCVMFKSRSQVLDWHPTNGMQVEVRGAPSLYEPRGEFQLTVDFIRRAGLGALYEQFARLKVRLEQEGLFDPARKRRLPTHARAVGIVTSSKGAALRDVLATLARRMPSVRVVIYPTQVQGQGGASQIASALEMAGIRRECDVLILCRGGGTIEDLWSFNEEVVARAIASCPIPVVSGIGHETDFTIADFVADLRAATPTAAAAAVSPDRAELVVRLRRLGDRLSRCLRHAVEQRHQQVDFLARRLLHPGERIAQQRRMLEHLEDRLCAAMHRSTHDQALRLVRLAHRLSQLRPAVERLTDKCGHIETRLHSAIRAAITGREVHVQSLSSHLLHLNPRRVLERGYSIVSTAGGNVIRVASQVSTGDIVNMTFAQGSATAAVSEVSR